MFQKVKLILVFIIVGILSLSGQNDIEIINNNVTQNKMKAHLSFLASDALKGRDTGSDGLEAAAAYISSQFIMYGVDTLEGYGDYLQDIPFYQMLPPDTSTLYIGDTILVFPENFLILNGLSQSTTMPAKFLNYGQEEDFSSEDVRFKFALANVGDGSSNGIGALIESSKTKRDRAIEAGAMGLIEIYQNAMIPWNFIKRMATQKRLTTDAPGNKRNEKFPHIWISSPDSITMVQLMDEKRPIQLNMNGLEKKSIPSSNVLGIVEGTDPILKDEYIIYSAHYDHVGIGRPDATGDTIYNGARDNAVGVMSVLMLADYIAAHPTKRSAVFVLFTAEEKGLLGSKWYVDHSPVPLEKVKYCFNIDNGGYNDTSVVSIIGLTRTEAEADLQMACNAFGLTAIEDPAKEQGLFDRSDNVNFAKKGIPAPTFSLGFRSFDSEIFKYYHQAGDEIESLDMDYIEKYVKAFVLAGIKIGNRETAPFWNVGDKYYQSGKQLYKE